VSEAALPVVLLISAVLVIGILAYFTFTKGGE